jgi:hypothetical protein
MRADPERLSSAAQKSTREWVREAWFEIYSETGQAPNDAKIKDWLVAKTGGQRNNTVISKELQAIRQEAEAYYFNGKVMPDLPAEFPTELVLPVSQFVSELLKTAKLWAENALEARRTEIEKEITAVRQAASVAVATAQQEAVEARAEAARLNDCLNDRERAIERATAEIASHQTRVVELERELSAEQVHRGEAVVRVAELQESLLLAKESSEAAAVAHRLELSRAEERHQGFERVMTDRVAEEQARAIALQSELSKLEHRHKVLRDERDSVALQLSEMTGKQSEASAQLLVVRQDLEARISELAVLRAKLSDAGIEDRAIGDMAQFARSAGWETAPSAPVKRAKPKRQNLKPTR